MVNRNKENTGTASSKNRSPVLSGKKIRSVLRWCVMIVVFAVVIVAGVAGYRYLQAYYSQMQAQIQAQIVQQDTEIARLSRVIEKSGQQLNAWREPLEQLSQSVQSNHQQLTVLNQAKTEAWRLQEVAHLIDLATQRLLITEDIPGAMVLLSRANQMIGALNDPTLIPVRRNLQKTITQLGSVHVVDNNDLYLKLDVLSEQAMQLPIRLSLPQEKQNPAQVVQQSVPPKTWQDHIRGLATQVWTGFVGLYRIDAHREMSVKVLATPMQAVYIRQNLRLLIEQAQWALLSKNQKIYQHSLHNAIRWLKQFFPQQEAGMQEMLRQLTELSAQTIDSKLPDDVVPLLKQMAQSLEQSQKTSVLPSTPQPNMDSTDSNNPVSRTPKQGKGSDL